MLVERTLKNLEENQELDYLHDSLSTLSFHSAKRSFLRLAATYSSGSSAFFCFFIFYVINNSPFGFFGHVFSSISFVGISCVEV